MESENIPHCWYGGGNGHINGMGMGKFNLPLGCTYGLEAHITRLGSPAQRYIYSEFSVLPVSIVLGCEFGKMYRDTSGRAKKCLSLVLRQTLL